MKKNETYTMISGSKPVSTTSLLVSGAGLNFTVSIGFVDSESVEDRADITSLVDLADKAMYSIKKDGKNNIACFTC